ncbi:hypothetical protein ACVSNS_01530 [Pseudomonas aeruginosa]
MPPHDPVQKGKADFAFSSSAPGTWNLSLEGSEPWMHLTLASSTDHAVVRTVATNDIALIKEALVSPGQGLVVRSFQAVFASDFPDNVGLGVSEVYGLIEGRTKKGEVFHRLQTRHGTFRFGGPVRLPARDENLEWAVRLYTAERPPKLYYAD